MSSIGIILISLGSFFFFQSCNSANTRIDKTENKSMENFTGIETIIKITDKNVSCTSILAYIVAQEAAKKSDRDNITSLARTCQTMLENEHCKDWSVMNFESHSKCRESFKSR